MDKETLLLKYFAESLSVEEEMAFTSLLEKDAEFRAQVAFEEDLQRTIQHRERAALKSKLKTYESQNSKGQKPTVFRRAMGYLKIAASLAVLLATSWFVYQSYTTPNLEKLYEANYSKFPNTVYTITRSDTLDNSPERKAFEAYEGNDLKAAVLYFEELSTISNLDYIPFFLGQSYLQNGQIEQALQQFESIVKKDTDFKSEALWYSSLGYLKLGNKSRARQKLQLLVTEGNYKKAQAQELLDTLD